MSLDNPNKLEKAIAWWKAFQYKRYVLYALIGLLALGAILWASNWASNWVDRRSIEKDKQKIANTVVEINDIKAQQANLALQEAEKRGELKRDQEELEKNIFGQEDAKKEVNAALTNYNKAVNANVNTNATAEDLQKALDKLK